MSVLKSVVKNGNIELEAPNDWPDGTEVRIEPKSTTESIGIRDEDWPDTPEAIARHVALMDQIEPLEFTEQEEAEWVAAREAQKAFEEARFNDHAEKLRKVWE